MTETFSDVVSYSDCRSYLDSADVSGNDAQRHAATAHPNGEVGVCGHGGGSHWLFPARQLAVQHIGNHAPGFSNCRQSCAIAGRARYAPRARRSRVQQTQEETAAGAEKADIAITPLAVPLLSGPGAITTVILLNNQARGLVQHMVLLVCIVAVSASSFLVLRLAAHGARWLNPIALNITTRLMGLLLAAVACQFIVNAFKDLKVIPA